MKVLTFWEEFPSIFNFFDGGDPEIRTWFLVRHNFTPFILCGIYIFLVKYIGPAFMKNRKPYKLRKMMIVYNLIIVFVYAFSVARVIYLLYFLDKKKLCEKGRIAKEDGTYTMLTYGWYAYLLKYVEFLDTSLRTNWNEILSRVLEKMPFYLQLIYLFTPGLFSWRWHFADFIRQVFFILRKRYDLVTNLHVIHHGILPIMGWIILRTETSGYQGLPAMINCVVHIIMYFYYALAAMGPAVRKYIWWKRYLTMLQMAQFVLMLILQVVVLFLGGCGLTKTSFLLNTLGASFFLSLFCNFYIQSFKREKIVEAKEK